MSDKTILQVKVGAKDKAPESENELKRVRDVIQDGLDKWGLDDEYHAYVTGVDVDISELPVLDEYADELADRIAERLE